MKKIICCILILTIIIGLSGIAFAGSQGSGLDWAGNPEWTKAWAYMSDSGKWVNVSVYLKYNGTTVAQANGLDIGYVWVETAWKEYNHSDCSVFASFDSSD